MGGKVAQLAASRRPEGLSGLILVAPAQPTPRRNPEEMRQGQLHAYDNRENVLKTIGSGRLTARPPSPEILEQIVEDSMSGSHEATMAYPSAARGRSCDFDSSPTAMSSGSSIVICMVARPSCQLSQEQLSSATLGPAHPGLAQRLGMLRYRVLARRRVPAPRRGHAIVLPSEENGFRARRTFAAPGRPSRETE